MSKLSMGFWRSFAFLLLTTCVVAPPPRKYTMIGNGSFLSQNMDLSPPSARNLVGSTPTSSRKQRIRLWNEQNPQDGNALDDMESSTAIKWNVPEGMPARPAEYARPDGTPNNVPKFSIDRQDILPPTSRPSDREHWQDAIVVSGGRGPDPRHRRQPANAAKELSKHQFSPFVAVYNEQTEPEPEPWPEPEYELEYDLGPDLENEGSENNLSVGDNQRNIQTLQDISEGRSPSLSGSVQRHMSNRQNAYLTGDTRDTQT